MKSQPEHSPFWILESVLHSLRISLIFGRCESRSISDFGNLQNTRVYIEMICIMIVCVLRFNYVILVFLQTLN